MNKKRCYICNKKFQEYPYENDYKSFHDDCLWLNKKKYIYHPKVNRRMNRILRRFNTHNQYILSKNI